MTNYNVYLRLDSIGDPNDERASLNMGFFRFEVPPVAGYGGGSRFEVSGRRLKQHFYMDSFVDKYKKMTIGAEEEELDLNEADVKVVAHERRARPPPDPPPWSASKSRIWKKMDELYFNSI
ncbi:unnamed protein product [Cuscuta epithymum]|uniref:Uncharacterized protein n=1 Tax=Cuscuta epithymum TaxID=186058 RepID=A0AAV0E2Q4_9ASTE|nr:unnamed protein product [Cuscuta epithymum]